MDVNALIQSLVGQDHSVQDQVAKQVMGPAPRMGEGPYANPGINKPMGWDYDTLASLMDESGMDINSLDDKEIDDTLNKLEAAHAQNNDVGLPIVLHALGLTKDDLEAPDLYTNMAARSRRTGGR